MTLVQTEPKSIKIWTTEIKRVTIRPNGTEKQIRPAWWTPWANTMCYYSFDNTLADGAWRYNNATNTWTTFTTVGNRKVLNITSNTYVTLPISDRWNLFTILFWFNTTDSKKWLWWPSYSAQDYPWTMEFVDDNYMSIQYWWNYATRREAYNTTNFRDGNWHLISFTSNNNQNWIVWVDTNFTTSYKNNNTTNYYFWWGSITLGRRAPSDASSITAKMGDFIIENKERTAQEVSDYYNQTKWNYWL